jgi:5S rRNA maturation endonuclease (ribonuclease M5)
MGLKVVDLYPPKKEERKLSLVATYDYRDETGQLLFQKQRFVDQWGKKTFRQRRPDPANKGKYIFSLDDTPKILYRLPDVLHAKSLGEVIWLVEGEKDADNLVKLGLCATTPPNGAGKWLDIHTRALEGAQVWIVADNDAVGRDHAKMVSKTLQQNGCTVINWVPPNNYKDVSELLGAGGSVDDLIEMDNAEPLEDIVQHEEEEQQTEAIIEATTPLIALAERINSLLTREDISETVRLTKASMMIGSFGHEDEIDRGRLVNWSDFLLEAENDSYDWIIPNVLERGERVIVVAAEGVGKTMLARQIAICSSFGINPFNLSRMKPIRTLTIDLENPERIIRRTSANIMGAARRLGYLEGQPECHILIKPSGVDLMRPSDRLIIEEAVETIKPDLILLGPIYKSFVDPGGRTSESITVEVAKYFDMLRDYYNCALWLEHHAPLGTSSSTRDLRPFGSAVWSRWPEFGLSLTPDPTAVGDYVYDVRHFRGARDLRAFPTKMRRGKVFPFEVIEFMEAS